MSFFDLNRKISYEHININKTSTKKWYEQLGATSSTLYTYGTTENEVEYYNAGKKLYKTFDCIKLNGDATLNFSSVFSNSDIENNYIFLKYYYVKYYYYDSEWDRPIYRWKYSSINEQTIDSGYTTILGNAIKLAADKSFLLPKGEYSLKGWEIIKISKEAVTDYFYADNIHKIGCSADKNNRVKDNLNVNKVIDSKYITDAKDYGNYAFYSIPSYAINNKNIRVFGDLDKSDNTGNYWNKDGIRYSYNDENNKEISFGSSEKSKYFREEEGYCPIVLFNDFGWSISDIPSSSNPLEIILDENRTNITISFKGNTKVYKLWDDDKIMLYARECTKDYLPQTIKYGYTTDRWGSNGSNFYGLLTNPDFIFNLKDIKIYNFYDFINNNKFELKDKISLENKIESYEYNEIVKKLDWNIKTTANNPSSFVFNPDVTNKYYNKYYRTDYYSFFFSTFKYSNLFFPSGLDYNIYFDYESFDKTTGLPTDSKWKIRYNYNEKPSYCYLWYGKIPKANNQIEFILTNNQRILNNSSISFATISGNDELNHETEKMTYTHRLSATAEASVGVIEQGTYSGINYLGRNMNNDTTTAGFCHYVDSFHGQEGLLALNGITLDINRSITINNKYASYANVNQPAIAIILWTKHENH